jgi:hypothetical protein
VPRWGVGRYRVGRQANCCEALQPMSTLQGSGRRPAAKPHPARAGRGHGHPTPGHPDLHRGSIGATGSAVSFGGLLDGRRIQRLDFFFDRLAK